MIEEMLLLAREWKEGRLHPVHPTIAQLFNQALARAHEDVVPFKTHTNRMAASLTDLIAREYRRESSKAPLSERAIKNAQEARRGRLD